MFNIGDTVECITCHDGNMRILHEQGVVVVVIQQYGYIGVSFDNYIGGHTLRGNIYCKQGHGWFLPPEKLVLISKTPWDINLDRWRKKYARV